MRSEQPRIDRRLLGTFLGLVGFGMLTLLSASGPLGVQTFGNSWYFFTHQLVYGVLPGIVLFFIFARLKYQVLRYLAFFALISSIVLLVLVYVPGIGLHFGGAGRWVTLGGFAFQPSEFVKVTFLLYVAAWLSERYKTTAHSLQEGLLPFLCTLGIVMGLLIMQPNTGSMAVIAGAALLTYFVSGAPIVWFVTLGVVGFGGLALLIHRSSYRAARFMTFLHPELDPQGVGYQINQAFLAIGSGGPFGVGYGHSRQKYLYLPEAAGDSIFAIMGEEMGFIVATLFLCALFYLVYRCFFIARFAPDAFGRFLAVSIGAWIGLQTFLNVGSMIGLVPITGVTLPFVSYGSSALIALCVAMGVVASISRQVKTSV